MYKYAPSLVLPGICLISVNILYSVFITFYRQNAVNKKKINLGPKLQSLVYALFGGIQKIKVTGAEKRAFAKWAEQYSEIEKLTYSPPFLLKISGVISTVISLSGSIILYYFAIRTGVDRGNY